MATKTGTNSIGPKQAARAFHSVRFANDNGRPLNLLVTVDFTTLGIDTDDAYRVFQHLWSRVARWWAYRRAKDANLGTFDCYAVHEHPEDGPRHVHWFLHVPQKYRAALEAAILKRVEKLSGLDCLGRAVHFLDVTKPGGVAKYTLKGVHPAYADHFHMEASDQGFISGRRLAISRSIGATARERAGWKRKRRPQQD
ncbi:hypothetical protein [Brevundimonas naejangsanensis]|uniref:hypothetical protein n=1 Tax=Brevundimonas naejangsanensis TaxID=588932 RepID=UPI0026EE23B1|nr:hypothetical protein [Brevundimonas naejangsanensis]